MNFKFSIALILISLGCTTTPRVVSEYGASPSSEGYPPLQDRRPSGQTPSPPKEAPKSKLAEKIMASKSADEIEKWINEAEVGYEKLPDTEKLVADELFLMKAFRGFRAKFDSMSRNHRIQIDPFFQKLTRIEFRKWSKSPPLETYVSMSPPNHSTPFQNERDFMAFFGAAILQTDTVARKILSLPNGSYPSLTCMFGCDTRNTTTNFQASAKVSSIMSQMLFVGGFSIEGLFAIYKEIEEPLMNGRGFKERHVKPMKSRERTNLFRLTSTGSQFLNSSYFFADRAVRFERLSNPATPNEAISSAQQTFYKNAPNDLKSFLGVTFDSVTGDAMTWNLSALNPFFPNARTSDELILQARQLRNAWVGNLPFPLDCFLNLDRK